VAAHPLAGVAAKLSRAREQFEELRAEMDTFFNADEPPYDSVGSFDSEAWEWVERFQIRREAPLRFGVILGDCLHNLRSSLDHLMWQVTLLDGNTPDASTQFPISRTEKAFEKAAKRQIPGLNSAHHDFVRSLQPFNAGDDAEGHALAVLATLSNTDKHRVLNPTYSFVKGNAQERVNRLVGEYRGPGESPVDRFWTLSEGARLEHGEPWFRIIWRRDAEEPVDVTLGGTMQLGFAFGEIGMDASDFPSLAETVGKIVKRLAADFPDAKDDGSEVARTE
jgi:hypothetical protein